MSHSEEASGCISLVATIGFIASWVGSGLLAWNWLEPSSFGQVIFFLIVWGVLGKVFDVIVTFILLLLVKNMMD